MRTIIPAVAAISTLCLGTAYAKTDPVFAGAKPAHAAPALHLNRAATLNVNFQVDFEGSSFTFPGTLVKGKHGALSGNVTAPSGCPGPVDSGSTDINGKLTLNVTFGGACAGEAGSFVGTLKFKAGTGKGTFTDPFASGPYVATHG
jgi:hypothetical protein